MRESNCNALMMLLVETMMQIRTYYFKFVSRTYRYYFFHNFFSYYNKCMCRNILL